MTDPVVERTPTAPVGLEALGARLAVEARDADSGHAALTLNPSEDGPFKQSLIALQQDVSLGPERWNGPATLVVLKGSVSLPGYEQAVTAQEWLPLDDEHSELVAREDAVVLLTVILTPDDPGPEPAGD